MDMKTHNVFSFFFFYFSLALSTCSHCAHFFNSLVISVGHPTVKHQARFHAARRRMCESDRTQWFDLQPLLLHLGNVILTCPSLSMSLAISHGHSKETHVLCSPGKREKISVNG